MKSHEIALHEISQMDFRPSILDTRLHAIHAFLIQRIIHLLYIFFTDCRYIYSRERHLRQSRTHQSVHLFVQLQQGKLGRAACRLGPRPQHTP
jgi:hypothetical protein